MSNSLDSYDRYFENTALFEFSAVINSSLDLRFILNHILLTLMGKLLTTRGMVLLAHERKNYRVEMTKGFPDGLEGFMLNVKNLPHSLARPDRLSARRHPWVKFFREQNIDILLPMYVRRHAIGCLAFGSRFSRKPLQKKESTYLRSLANISANAIEKIHTIEELSQVNRKLDRKIQELNTLFELGKEFGSVLDPEKLVRLLVLSLMGQIGVSRYLICLRERGKMRTVAMRVDGDAPSCEVLTALGKARGPVLLEECPVVKGTDPRPGLSRLGMRIVIPLQLGGESRGVILLGEKLSREPFGQADFEFLSALGSLAIISLENARLFQEAIEKQKMEDELKIAREIQKGLLPGVLPAIPGLEIAATNYSSKQVGGDYYDVIQLDEARYILAIGDVSGKGTPAALLMANLQATIRALVPLGLSLSELTTRVNSLMCLNTGGNKFVTFFWGCVDARSKTLTYVNAGHNHPFLLRRDNSLERLDRGGMILGVLDELPPYEQRTLQLHPGDLLVLFTDGVSEAMTADAIEYGEDRLEQTIRRVRHSDAQTVLEAIQHDVLVHVGGAPQSDDITLMVLRMTSSEE